MTFLIILTFLIICIACIVVLNNSGCEPFLTDEKKPKFLYDKLFDDVTIYDNDADGRLGLDKCLEANCGVCLEYGVTGNALCFPRTRPLGNNALTINNSTFDQF